MKIVASILFCVVCLSLYLSVKFGLNPRAVKKINPTKIENMGQAGALIYRRLSQEIKSRDIVLLGSSEKINQPKKVWEGLLKTANFYNKKFDVILSYKKTEASDSSFIDSVLSQVSQGQKVLIYTSSFESNQLVEKSLASRLKSKKVKVLGISQTPFVVSKKQLESISCVEQETLSCKAQEMSRLYFRKSYSVDEARVAVQNFGIHDYILFVYQPKVSGQ